MQIMLTEVYQHSLINDFELDKLAVENPAHYFRRLWGYLDLARGLVGTNLPKFRFPLTPPKFSFAKTTMDGTTNEWAADLIGYDMAVVLCIDAEGNTTAPPSFSYNPMTGKVAFDAPPVGGVTCDGYSDGWFDVPDASAEDFIHLLRIAILAIWDERFASSSLDRMQKASGRTFEIKSEGNWLRENAAKSQGTRAWLNAECIRIEQKLTLGQ